MPTLAELTAASLPLSEATLFYCVQSGESRKLTGADLWGYALGISATVERGFFGAAPVARPAGVSQAAVTLTMATVATATVGAAVATTGATNTTPYGFTTAAQANDLVSRVNQLRDDVTALVARVTEAKADIASNTTLTNKIRDDLVSLGLIKGSA